MTIRNNEDEMSKNERHKFTPAFTESLESRALLAANPLHAEIGKINLHKTAPATTHGSIHAAAVPLKNSLLAQYKFNGNGFDSTGKNPMFLLTNTRFANGSLYLNGIYDFNNPNNNGYHARVDSYNLSYRKFTISLTFKADSFSTESYETPLLIGGEDYRWFVLKRSNEGKLAVRLNNHVYEYTAATNTKIAAGKWNTVVCGIDLETKQLTAYLNGQKMIDVALPSNFAFNVGNTETQNSQRHWAFTNYSNGTTFKGYIDAFSYYNSKLSNRDMQKLSASGRR